MEGGDASTSSRPVTRFGKTGLQPIVATGVHILGGLVLFVLVAVAAWASHVAVHLMEANGVPTALVLGMTVLEYFTFAADIVLVVVFALGPVQLGLKVLLAVVRKSR